MVVSYKKVLGARGGNERPPESGRSHVREFGEYGSRELHASTNRRKGDNRSGAAGELAAAAFKSGARLQVAPYVCPADSAGGDFVVLQCVLVDRGVDKAQLVENAGCLGTLARAHEVRHGDGREEGDDRHDDHNFNKGEALAVFVYGKLHNIMSAFGFLYVCTLLNYWGVQGQGWKF